MSPIPIPQHAEPISGLPRGVNSCLQDFPDCQFIHHHWVDISSVFRARVLTKEHCLVLEKNHQPATTYHAAHLGLMNPSDRPRSFVPSSAPALHPDWSSARKIKDGHVSVLCDISEAECGYWGIDYSKPFERSSRAVLTEVLTSISQKHVVDFLVGFELEFYLVDAECDIRAPQAPRPWRPTSYSSLASSLRGASAACVEYCVANLKEAGIGVQQYHSEEGEGQYEISLDPMRPLAAIDTMLQAQEIVKLTAVRHSMQALFVPKPFAAREASGLHIHVSYTHPGSSDTDFRTGFLAGVLNRLPLLCAFGMPSELSYRRLQDTLHFQNLIRPQHWEFRFVDTTANPYLALASILAAGAIGVEEREPLDLADNRESPARLSLEERQNLGIKTSMPKSLEEAMKIAQQGWQGLDRYINEKMLGLYLLVKESELKRFAGRSSEELAKFYADVF